MPSERFTGLSSVLNAIRSAAGITQPMLVDKVNRASLPVGRTRRPSGRTPRA